jgi:hypothetical protein
VVLTIRRCFCCCFPIETGSVDYPARVQARLLLDEGIPRKLHALSS